MRADGPQRHLRVVVASSARARRRPRDVATEIPACHSHRVSATGRRITIRRYGPPSVLQPEPFEPTAPARGEVQVEVAFVSVNFADLMQRMGLYQAAPKRPFVPGFEVSGTIAALGAGVDDVAVGDDVAAVSRFGAYTSHLNVPVANLFPTGDLSLAEAAAFPTVYLTAWEALVGMARARAGDRVLVHGGAGGVGLAAIGVARHLGCEVHATTGSAAKLGVLREQRVAGAYCTSDGTDWVEAVRAATRPALRTDRASDGGGVGGRGGTAARGVDIVLEPGGPRQLRDSLRVLAPRGRVVLYGAQEVAPRGRRDPIAIARTLWTSRFPLLSLVPRNAGIMAFHLLYLWEQGVDLRAEAETLLGLVRDKKIPRPHVDKVFAFDEVAAAHQYIHDRKNVGKVLLEP
jgi:NADPH:quinone reductase-like Zn-dependent oxidoreductase